MHLACAPQSKCIRNEPLHTFFIACFGLARTYLVCLKCRAKNWSYNSTEFDGTPGTGCLNLKTTCLNTFQSIAQTKATKTRLQS